MQETTCKEQHARSNMQRAIYIASLRGTRSSRVQKLYEMQGNAEKLTESKFEGSLQGIATTRWSHVRCTARAKKCSFVLMVNTCRSVQHIRMHIMQN